MPYNMQQLNSICLQVEVHKAPCEKYQTIDPQSVILDLATSLQGIQGAGKQIKVTTGAQTAQSRPWETSRQASYCLEEECREHVDSRR